MLGFIAMPLTRHSMGFARLAETSIRKIKGKSETDSLGPFDKILASSIGGALATWNQPIEVVRVEVFPSLTEPCPLLTLSIDAINGEEHCQCQPPCETHHFEHPCLHL